MRRHEIIQMLGCHASIQKSTDIKQDQKYQQEHTEESHWVIAQINQHIIKINY